MYGNSFKEKEASLCHYWINIRSSSFSRQSLAASWREDRNLFLNLFSRLLSFSYRD